MKNGDKFISFAVAFQVIIQGCKNILVQGFPMLYNINNQLNIIIMGISLFLYVTALFYFKKQKTPIQAILILLFVAFTYGFTYVFFPQNYVFIQNTILRTLISCFFTFLLVSKLKTFDYLNIYFTGGSYLLTICGILYALIINIIGHTATSDWSTYSMTMSNVLLLSVMWQLNKFFTTKDILALTSSLLGFAIIFLYGSRNPLLAIITFITISILLGSNRSNNSNSKILKWVFIFLGLMFYLNFKGIINFIASILEFFGLNSRTLYYITNAETEDFSTGRNEIHDQLWDIICNNSFIGLGVSGDEVAIKELAHSLYLSVFITYGIFMGICVLIFIISLTIKGLKKAKGCDCNLIFMYACIVFPRSFTGGDIWANDYLWFLMGLVISSLYNRKKLLLNSRNLYEYKKIYK